MPVQVTPVEKKEDEMGGMLKGIGKDYLMGKASGALAGVGGQSGNAGQSAGGGMASGLLGGQTGPQDSGPAVSNPRDRRMKKLAGNSGGY